MISIRGKVWFILLALIRKRIGSLLKVTKSRRIKAASQRWKKNNKFLISEKFLDKIKVIEFEPKNSDNEGVILYLHGGGYVTCGPETHASLVTQLSEFTRSKIIFPEYRLAPKDPFPAAIDDCLMVYQELIRNGIDSKNISLVGDSAGGGLVMALLQIIQRDNLDTPSSAVLISPWTDLTLSGDSMSSRVDRDPMLMPGKDMDHVVKSYLNGEDPKNPLISSIFCEDLKLPPMQIHVGTEEILFDDSLRLFEKISTGNNVKLEIWDGMFHVFNIFCKGFLAVPEAKKANLQIANFISENYPRK